MANEDFVEVEVPEIDIPEADVSVGKPTKSFSISNLNMSQRIGEAALNMIAGAVVITAGNAVRSVVTKGINAGRKRFSNRKQKLLEKKSKNSAETESEVVEEATED